MLEDERRVMGERKWKWEMLRVYGRREDEERWRVREATLDDNVRK